MYMYMYMCVVKVISNHPSFRVGQSRNAACTYMYNGNTLGMYMYSRSQIKVHVSSLYYDRNTKQSYSSFQPFKRYAAILFQNAHALTTPLC